MHFKWPKNLVHLKYIVCANHLKTGFSMSSAKSYRELISTFESARKKIETFRNISGELFFMKPGPGRWSADEICRHITSFNNLYIGAIEKAGQSSPVFDETGKSFSAGFLCRKYVAFLEPPYTVKIPTIKPFRPEPKSTVNRARDVISKLADTEDKLIELLTNFEKNRIDLEKTKGKNPILTFLPMSVIDFIVLFDAHQRRHFWQLDQTVQQLQKADT
jgi:hypothetical protein